MAPLQSFTALTLDGTPSGRTRLSLDVRASARHLNRKIKDTTQPME